MAIAAMADDGGFDMDELEREALLNLLNPSGAGSSSSAAGGAQHALWVAAAQDLVSQDFARPDRRATALERRSRARRPLALALHAGGASASLVALIVIACAHVVIGRVACDVHVLGRVVCATRC